MLFRSLSNSEAVWEWENEKGTWIAYSPKVQRLLTACHLCGVDSVKVEGAGRKRYTVDLKAMKARGQRGGQEMEVRRRDAAGEWVSMVCTKAFVSYLFVMIMQISLIGRGLPTHVCDIDALLPSFLLPHPFLFGFPPFLPPHKHGSGKMNMGNG